MSDQERPLRLFVALELPADVREALAAEDTSGLRAVPLEALHLTLAFLGARPPSDVDAIARVLQAEAGTPAPRLATAGTVLLPRGRPRVVAVALDDLEGTLAGLQSRLSSGLEAAGVYTPEKRPFRAHVTFARVRPRALLPRIGSASSTPIVFTADRLTLFQSQLHPKGARYTAVTGAMLAH
jgi:RNA 2',3'-cyclic 3'-phosphodiesterase